MQYVGRQKLSALQKCFYVVREGNKSLSGKKLPDKYKRISSAADNMSALIDDIVKKARKSFRSTGQPDIDAKFLKESVGALRELFGLLEECDGTPEVSDGVIIRFEKQIEEWSK